MNALAELMAADLSGPAPGGLEPLVGDLAGRFGESLLAVVLYGSCLRSADPGEGLVDLMAIVTGYRAAHGSHTAALANAVLPPSVYYLEAGDGARRVRSKFIVISMGSLARRCRGGLDGYFWARFTQPCRLVWVRNRDTARAVAEYRARAAVHFANQAQSLGNGLVTGAEFWARALDATYGCELRPEPPGSGHRLVENDFGFWRSISARVLPRLAHVETASADRYEIQMPAASRAWGGLVWYSRRAWSKMLNLARLIKAAGTFSNGLDYLAWKVERHSGVAVETTDRMRRYPRIAAWGLAWKLWRRGAFR